MGGRLVDTPAALMRRPPFTPFRAGPPDFQVGLAPIAPKDWMLPDSEAGILDWREGLLANPAACYRTDPAFQDGEAEAAGRVIDAAGAAPPDGASLLDAARHVSDDLVVLHKAGQDWRVTSIVLTSPTFFSAEHAFDEGLAALHGPVPDGDRLARRIGRVFDALRAGLVLERHNWTLQAGPDRFTPDGEPVRARARAASSQEAEALLHLRVERQTITRLPGTGGVLFTIRVAIDPVTELAPDHRAPLAAAWRGISAEGFAYKNWQATDRLARALFACWGV